MRGLNDSNADASPVGETETTQRFFSRNHPIFTHLALCDHPGAGARRHPVATYVKDNWLRCYDGVLLVTATRFFENDIKIAKELHDARVPIFFIRNKECGDLFRSFIAFPFHFISRSFFIFIIILFFSTYILFFHRC
jgi:hypothetical protein